MGKDRLHLGRGLVGLSSNCDGCLVGDEAHERADLCAVLPTPRHRSQLVNLRVHAPVVASCSAMTM